jgi:hypothetical protein
MSDDMHGMTKNITNIIFFIFYVVTTKKKKTAVTIFKMHTQLFLFILHFYLSGKEIYNRVSLTKIINLYGQYQGVCVGNLREVVLLVGTP